MALLPLAHVLVALAPWAAATTQTPAPTPAPTPVRREEIVVAAARVEISERDVPAHISVLRESDVRESVAFGTDDMLRRVPGFSLFRQGSGLVGSPATNSASMRGLGGSAASRTLVLVDGLPLTDPYNATVPFQRVPTEWIERVEIVRGGGSVAWGNLALGGVINLRTLESASSGARIGVAGGEGGLVRTSASVIRGDRRLGGAVFGLFSNFDGYHIIRADQRGAIDERAGSDQRVLEFKGHWGPRERIRLRAGASTFSERLHRGTPLVRDENRSTTARADGEYVAGSGDAFRALVAYSSQNGRSVFSTTAPSRQTEVPSADQYERPASALTASLGWSRLLGNRHLLSAGADLLSTQAGIDELNTYSGGAFTQQRSMTGSPRLFGFYAQANSPIGSRLRVNIAGRLDSFAYRDMSRVDRLLSTGQILRSESFAREAQWTANPSLGLVFQASSAWTLKASVYRAFRAPAVSELINPFRASGNVVGEGNPLLTPEYVSGVEGGVHFATPTGRIALTGFWNTLKDPIATVTVGQAGRTPTTIPPCGAVAAFGSCRVRQNLGKMRSSGAEFEGQQRVGAFTFDVAYLWNRTEVLDAGPVPDLEGKENRNAPRHQVSFGAALAAPKQVSLWVRGRYVSQRFEDDINSLVVAGFFVADVRASRSWNRRLETYAGVENLLNRTFEVSRTSTGLVTIGGPRLARVGVRVQF